jgi:phosphoribosylaminoimidazole-succinocarboxamide synthase
MQDRADDHGEDQDRQDGRQKPSGYAVHAPEPMRGAPGILSEVELLHSGKVRDVYADGDDVILVATDRVSVFDVVLPTPIPERGKILTQLSLWWFERLADVVPNHVISEDVPAEWAGRAIRCRRLRMLPVECIARGYLAGSGLVEYEKRGAVSGVRLPPGLVDGSRLDEPVFTPTTKATVGHDEFITFEDVVAEVGAENAARLRELTLRVYRRGAAVAAERGVIIADTKLEFGLAPDGTLTLADEVLTPDSSRFWPAGEWRPGGPQPSMDKQFLREWSATTGWDRTPPGPPIPDEVVAATMERYVEVYERITGLRRRG